MHPILFHLGKLPIGSYGVAIVIGMLTGLSLAGRLARRRGMRVEFFYDLAFVLLLCGFAGARLLYILQNWEEFTANPMGLLLSRQGFVFQGGFIAATVAGILYTRASRMPLFGVADAVAPGLALAHGFGRIGCFLAGCCYGKVCGPEHASGLLHALSVRYPLNLDAGGQISEFNFAYYGQLAQGVIREGMAPLPIVPVQLFESFGNFLICLALVWAWRRRRFSGQIFALYMMTYSVLRFSLEFLRGDAERHFYLGMPTGQWIAIATLIGGAALWLARRGQGLELIPEPVEAEAAVAQPAAPAKKSERKAAEPARAARRRR